ncbi:short-chain dehydrogenase/reductase-like protein SDR [Ilyonectria robusta]|uniref:short-chain dehydrogenase/reductase-like protein SDR n=1 Tax=Ilyonectria robusta TaxID=1079257 RepID=UPI001E8CC6ED|nr:short-chain dehydrogenase/reductase-like protein SDR [Ilyonectria robusta]KAH8645907.1 short-chain dehydrogenase/reductase-like protein SDR [Ilyonectria robusta]
METILVVGASGNIGVSAVKAALNTGRNVLAVVRNQASTSKLFKHVGTSQGITAVEADVTSPDGVQSVVDRVLKGELPPFHHVYSSVGTFDLTSPITKLDTQAFRRTMNINLEANFCAAGDSGWGGVTAIGQGALFSLANVTCRELTGTNILDHDEVAKEKDGRSIESSVLAPHYGQILARPEISASRVSLLRPEDIKNLKFQKKLG